MVCIDSDVSARSVVGQHRLHLGPCCQAKTFDIDVINAAFEVMDHVRAAVLSEIEKIDTITTKELIIALAAADEIISITAIERVIANITEKEIIAFLAPHNVIVDPSLDCIIVAFAVDRRSLQQLARLTSQHGSRIPCWWVWVCTIFAAMIFHDERCSNIARQRCWIVILICQQCFQPHEILNGGKADWLVNRRRVRLYDWPILRECHLSCRNNTDGQGRFPNAAIVNPANDIAIDQ